MSEWDDDMYPDSKYKPEQWVEVKFDLAIGPGIRGPETMPREQQPWVPGWVNEVCGPDEWQVLVMHPSLAIKDEEGFATYPLVFRAPCEIREITPERQAEAHAWFDDNGNPKTRWEAEAGRSPEQVPALSEPFLPDGSPNPYQLFAPRVGVVVAGQEAGFPDGYTGAGPMFAAVPLGRQAHGIADAGGTAYDVRWPDALSFDGCVFLDRQDAEQAADARADGEFWRIEGLCTYAARTPAAAARIAAEPGWPSLADHPSDVRLVADADLGMDAPEAN